MTELATLPRDIQLLRQACNFLAECRDLDELKSLKDKAEGAAAVLRQAEGRNYCRASSRRESWRSAARRIGEVSKAIETAPPINKGKLMPNVGISGKLSVLADAGIRHQEASRCEAIATIPKHEFEASIQNGKSVTLSALEKNGRAKTKEDTRTKAAQAIAKEPPPLPKGPFRVIAVNPPWTYKNRADDDTHRAANPYPSMTIEQIKGLDVGSLAGPDCVLWLWTTNAHMREAFNVLDAWGFTFKTITTHGSSTRWAWATGFRARPSIA